MARKNSANASHARGVGDVIGLVLVAVAVLLFLAQVSFDRNDVASNRVPPNETIHNWIGSAGAHVTNGLFFLFGAGAFLIPLVALLSGAGCLFQYLSYLRRRWPWAAALLLSTVGFFDLYTGHFERLKDNLNTISAGGLIGKEMNALLFGHLGVLGATIIFATVYLVSLIYLTNFRLSAWVRAALTRAPEAESPERAGSEEQALARRARELEKEARKLQEQVERSGLGADLQSAGAQADGQRHEQCQESCPLQARHIRLLAKRCRRDVL